MHANATRFTLISILAAALALSAAGPVRAGELELKVIDAATGEPIAARLHIKDKRGKTPKMPKLKGWQDHVMIDGEAVITLPNGNYTFEAERGLEYRPQSGHFEFETGAKDENTIAMKRFVDMAKEGWWSGDLQVCRRPDEMDLLMRAEDLHVASVVTWSTAKNPWIGKSPPAAPLVSVGRDRVYELIGGEDACPGGNLLLSGLANPPTVLRAGPHAPTTSAYLAAAKSRGASGIAATPFALELPLWVATGKLDAIQVAHAHLLPASLIANEAGGKGRDRVRYPDPFGNARWSHDIYFHLLNCGLRIAPAAGSGSGLSPSPAGYDRVYVYLGPEPEQGSSRAAPPSTAEFWNRWWTGLREGKVVVTNGPMLRPLCNGQPPGHVFRTQDKELSLQLTANLATRDPVDYFEVIHNGRVVQEVRLDKWAEAGGQLPLLTFKESGWCLVRVVSTNPTTYRFAMSGPFYVELGQPRISRKSAQFFVDWVEELRMRTKTFDSKEQPEALAEIDRAAEYWKGILSRVNAE